jgi:Lrp/AsnC family transcriptional regulator, regulator for asnA, asnC and gidA
MSKTLIPLPFDKLDYQIIKCLNQDARMSAAEMEALTGANQRTIRKRLARLLEFGTIRLKGVVEPKVFGFGISVDIFLTLTGDDEKEIIKRLNEMSPISYIATGQNSSELSIEARFQDSESMEIFLKQELPAITGLEIRHYTLVPRIIKNIDEWLPPPEIFND